MDNKQKDDKRWKTRKTQVHSSRVVVRKRNVTETGTKNITTEIYSNKKMQEHRRSNKSHSDVGTLG